MSPAFFRNTGFQIIIRRFKSLPFRVLETQEYHRIFTLMLHIAVAGFFNLQPAEQRARFLSAYLRRIIKKTFEHGLVERFSKTARAGTKRNIGAII
jgi:hypothetical protein